jgi:hypothetical protein
LNFVKINSQVVITLKCLTDYRKKICYFHWALHDRRPFCPEITLVNRIILESRRVWRYERGNQNPYIEEVQTTQLPKLKVQKDKQRSTKHTYNKWYKTKDWVTRTPLKSGGELRCCGRVSSSCSTSDTRHANLVTNPVISHERGKDQEVFTTRGTYPRSFVTQIFHNGQPSCGGNHKTFEVITILQNDYKMLVFRQLDHF